MNTYIQNKLDKFRKLTIQLRKKHFTIDTGGDGIVEVLPNLEEQARYNNGIEKFIEQALTDYHNHIVENIKNELGDFAHTRYLGCHSENDKWHYSYDTEVVYIVDEYLKSLQDTNPKE